MKNSRVNAGKIVETFNNSEILSLRYPITDTSSCGQLNRCDALNKSSQFDCEGTSILSHKRFKLST